MERYFAIHRSEAIKKLLEKERYPMQYTNIKLGELLEHYYPKPEGVYIVKEDDLPL